MATQDLSTQATESNSQTDNIVNGAATISLTSTYWSQDGDKSFSDLTSALVKVEDIVCGMRLVCEARLNTRGLTWEEVGFLTLLNLGVCCILEKMGEVMPMAAHEKVQS